MSDFYECKLQDVCLGITDGKHGDCQNEENSGYYFVSCKDIFDGRINLQKARQITEEDYIETHKRTKLDNCDIVITNSGSIGRMAIIDHLYHRITFQKSVAIIKPDRNKIVPRYLYYYLLSNVANLVDISGGTAQKNLLLSDMRNFHIIVSNKLTQDKIACILTFYDNLIENNNRRITILEEMAQKLYREWFVHFRFPGHENIKMVESEMGLIPEGWGCKSLFDVADVQYGFAFKSKLFCDDSCLNPVVRIRDILGNGTQTYSPETPDEKYLICNGDILIGMDGIFHMNQWSGGRAYLNQRVAKLVPKTMSTLQLFYGLKPVIGHLEATISGTTVAHLSNADLKKIMVLVADDNIQQNANELFELWLQEKIILQQKNTNLRKTRDLLLPRLISGDIDVSDLDIPVKEG